MESNGVWDLLVDENGSILWKSGLKLGYADSQYIQKIQETTKPYVDAAEHKAEELFEKLEHKLDVSFFLVYLNLS